MGVRPVTAAALFTAVSGERFTIDSLVMVSTVMPKPEAGGSVDLIAFVPGGGGEQGCEVFHSNTKARIWL